jgi:putative thioredoxin
MLLPLSPDPAPVSNIGIKETNAAAFEQDVIVASLERPVIVQFWAPWCGPCKQLSPVLEKAVAATQGAMAMVKVNLDTNPELAQIFRVQSVPAVYAFFQGQPVDGFMGAQPESKIAAFITKLKDMAGISATSADDHDIAEIMSKGQAARRAGAWHEAMAHFSTALDAAPDHAEALAGLAWCFADQGEIEGLETILNELTPEQQSAPCFAGLLALQNLRRTAATAAPEDPLFDAAQRHLAAGHVAPAIDALLELTIRDRNWQDGKARALLLDMFAALGPEHPLTAPARRRLSSVLFA